MEKIQHNINSLSLILSGFFLIEIIALGFGASMQSERVENSDIASLVAFYSMIPVSILLLQLCAKYKSQPLLWVALGLFLAHVLWFLF